MKRMLSNQRGVAMVTVLFVGTALTVVASAAAFVAVRDLKAGGDDRRGAEALAFAESGVDRMVELLRAGGTYIQSSPTQADIQRVGIPTWSEMNEAGCALGPLQVPIGDLGTGRTYTVSLTAYDPTQPLGQRTPPEPWSISNDTSSPVCTTRNVSPRPTDDVETDHLFAISSLGQHPAAKREVLQIVQIEALGLPVGVFADSSSNNGNPDFTDISLVTPGNVTGREKVSLKGLDPYYTMRDFYGDAYPSLPIPTAVHAMGTITCISDCNSAGTGSGKKQEHPPALNCGANGTDDGAPTWQSMWDGSGLGGPIAGDCAGRQASGLYGDRLPPTSLFNAEALQRVTPRPTLTEDDYERLKQGAKDFGLYCTNIGSEYCTVRGQSVGYDQNISDTDLANWDLKRFIAYFDYKPPTSPSQRQTLTWNANVTPCSSDPSLDRSVVLVIRNGDMSTQGAGAGEVIGAFLIPEGILDAAGSITIHGTMIADGFQVRGTGNFKNSSCWVRNMPSAFLDYSTTHWSEVDR